MEASNVLGMCLIKWEVLSAASSARNGYFYLHICTLTSQQ